MTQTPASETINGPNVPVIGVAAVTSRPTGSAWRHGHFTVAPVSAPAGPTQRGGRDQVSPRRRPLAATRHLCAGAYVDDKFRQRSLNEVYYESARAVAPSYGFDLITVLWHCLRARRLAVLRDAMVVVSLILVIVLASNVSIGGSYYILMVVVVLLLLVFVVVSSGASLWRQRALNELAPGRVPSVPRRSRRFDEIHRQQGGNTIAYSGYWPFVGSGYHIKTWGIAQRLIRAGNLMNEPRTEAEREFAEPPFSAIDIVSYIGHHLASLVDDSVPERHLPGLTLMDKIFVAAVETIHPVSHTDPQRMSEVIRHPTGPARHYLACQVVSWDGELVTTVYVHFAVQGKSLYVEFASMALPPCDERYRIIDQVGGTGRGAYLGALVRGVVEAPRVTVLSPLNLIREAVSAATGVVRQRSLKTPPDPGYDYGTRVSVREMASPNTPRSYAQSQDVDKYQRIIERRVVSGILDFLCERGVDTAEFVQRTLTILNAGAVNTGSGSVTVHGDAVGAQGIGSAGSLAQQVGSLAE
jgi:hypothetical protein